MLDQLARLDKSPWPETIPEQIDHPMWEFSFAGEPIFVRLQHAGACNAAKPPLELLGHRVAGLAVQDDVDACERLPVVRR